MNKELIKSAFSGIDNNFYFQVLVNILFIGKNILKYWIKRDTRIFNKKWIN